MYSRAERWADTVLRASLDGQTAPEKRRAERLARLLADAQGRELVFRLTDEVLRTDDDRRAARRLRSLVRAGLPSALGVVDRAGLRGASAASRLLPATVARVVRARLHADTR